ncbi:MAG: hypothetical protein M1839_006784 [Geoglossum umbratile]|nr:MAG: hypothetical protein M1839_006784 [Geoglossum umbratile]
MPRDMIYLGRWYSPEPDGENAQTVSPLTSLPPELRLQIISELQLDQLSAVVHASSAFHRDYRRTRMSTLRKCLQLTFRSAAIDAYAVFQSYSDEFAETWTRKKVKQFLLSYQDQRASAHNSHFTDRLTEGEAIRMAAFHSTIIKPLARCYVDCTLRNLFDETNGPLDKGLLSKAEETRVLRALYRFQLCCNLFGKGRFDAPKCRQRSRHPFDDSDILKLFFCLFEPWEVEEIVCIYAFAKQTLGYIFGHIRWDVHKENPKYESQGRYHPPVGTFDFDTDGAWSKLTQWSLRQGPPSHREQKQQRRDPLPFTGDGDSETDGPHPPLAWTIMWGGTYSNLFGEYVQHVIHQWGYVIWDAARLERTGVKELVVWQSKQGWKNLDPRDHLD